MIITSSVGFRDRSTAEFYDTYLQLCENGEIFETKNAKYLRWAVGDNLGLWTRVKDSKPEMHYHPFFEGDARMVVALLEKTPRRKELFSDGAFFCRSSASAGNGWVAGRAPFVFDTPCFHRYDDLQIPRLATVQLAAFAFTMKGYADEEEFDVDYPEDEQGCCWDYKHFVPVSMIEPRGEDNELQPAGAEVSGYVLDSGILTNPSTGIDFCWAKVETIGGEVDMVCAPERLDGYIVKGGIAVANCHLSGRLIEDRSN